MQESCVTRELLSCGAWKTLYLRGGGQRGAGGDSREV